MTIKANDLVLIEHPMMMERHVIARAVKDATASTVQVIYYNDRNGWTDEPKRRSVSHVFGALPANTDVAKTSSNLLIAVAEREERIKEARLAYRAEIKGMVA